ncbi:MAG: tripartite tricarboxylate transporter substrate-binding protein, partial [Dehalococcoidia bacterium]
AAKPFYEGKTITIVVGFGPGGGYDAYARLVARHLGKYIPGNPSVIVQNRPGAGSMTAANFIYNKAKPDGLTIGTFIRDMGISGLRDAPGVEFDWDKFGWIGSANSEVYVIEIRTETGVKTVEDLVNRAEPTIMSVTAKTTGTYLFMRALQETLGAKFKFVVGYPDSAAQALAMERKEVEGMGGSYSSLVTMRPHWLEQEPPFVVIPVQSGEVRNPALPDVPTIVELVTGEDAKTLARLVGAANEVGRPYVAPPGIPADRLKILRDAFAQAMVDPDLLAEAKKGKRPIRLLTGEQTQEMAGNLLQASPETIARFQMLSE